MKGTFWRFYSVACRQAYTKKNIASAFRATGICPFNPDAVTRLITGDTNPVTVPTSTVVTSSQPAVDILSQLKTPRKSRDVHQQIQLAIEVLCQTGDVNVAIAVVKRYGHTTQTALATAEIRGTSLLMYVDSMGARRLQLLTDR